MALVPADDAGLQPQVPIEFTPACGQLPIRWHLSAPVCVLANWWLVSIG